MTHAYDPGVANRLGALALALADAVHAATAESARAGPSAPAALVALDAGPGGETIDALRRRLDLTHSGTVRLVDRLVASQLVERRAGPDGRSVGLHLTPVGRRAARRIVMQRQTALESALAPLSSAQRATLDRLVSTLLEGFRDLEPRVCRLCDRSVCARCPTRD